MVALVTILGSGWCVAIGPYRRFLVAIVIFQEVSHIQGAPEPVLPPLSSSLEKVREDPRLESSFLHVCAHNSLLTATDEFLGL
ncbi:hypothetical protein BGY98DRAFT_1053528 [Russula aff. rugulosa BPL654]|nr:hypothetical protein BGY98DRAFT_1053528 [Russula aff. rugulosa BPL654]